MEAGSDEYNAGLEEMGKKGIQPSGSAANLHRMVENTQIRHTEAIGNIKGPAYQEVPTGKQ